MGDFRQWECSEKDNLVWLELKYCNAVETEITQITSFISNLLVQASYPQDLWFDPTINIYCLLQFSSSRSAMGAAEPGVLV